MNYSCPQNSRSRKSRIFSSRIVFVALAAFALLALVTTPALMDNPHNGNIQLTDNCITPNVHTFLTKQDVRIKSGIQANGQTILPNGNYYVRVTDAGGNTVLGTSLGSGDDTPFVVNNGVADCDILWNIVKDGANQGFADTPNGVIYKLWVSIDSSFNPNNSAIDTFMVGDGTANPQGLLTAEKFYDLNANGIFDDGDTPITGWQISIKDETTSNVDNAHSTSVSILVAPGPYTLTECTANVPNWIATTATSKTQTVVDGGTADFTFGNVCIGPGGGLTLGYWSNKNGQATMNDGGTLCPELTMLNTLCLRNGSGGDADFACNYAQFRTWILGATATNMAYMLSAQLAAMELNVEATVVNGNALIYAPGTTSANSAGFAKVNAVMAEANATLCANGVVLDGNPERAHQEAVKNALDNANNNKNFVQASCATPASFTCPL
jgi:hypothetical protein